MTELIRLENSTDVSFQASAIQAFFPNNAQVNFTSDDLQVLRHSKDEYVLVFHQQQQEEEGTNDDHMIRLYLTTPGRDWRRNVSYSWQLSMAWMSGTGGTQIGANGWMFWNRENTINSQILGLDDDTAQLFSAESVTLHFKEPAKHMSRGSSMFGDKPPSTKIIMKDVLMGSRLTKENTKNLKPYRPCSSAVCELVDGVVTSESGAGVAAEAAHVLEGLPVYAMVALLVIPVVMIYWVGFRCLCRYLANKKMQKYTPIGEDTEVLDDSNEDNEEEEPTEGSREQGAEETI